MKLQPIKGNRQRVRITPKCQRARNRVREHGHVMFLRRVERMQHNNMKLGVFCDSLDGVWFGWFDEDEADWEML